jgi:hypothetical protein
MISTLSKKPFYSSITIIVFLPLAVFFICGILILFGMSPLEENKIDNVVHGFGGGSACLSSAGVLWHLVRRQIIKLQDENVFRLLVFGFLSFVIIGWEIFEYIVFYPDEVLTYTDTISDMICGLIGGLFAMYFLRKPVLCKNSS